MVRAGDDNELIEAFMTQGFVSIGWKAMGDMSALADREAFKRAYTEAYPDESRGKINVNAGQVFRFMREMHPGDLVLTYDKSTRVYSVGEISSGARYDPSSGREYPNLRSVNWSYSVKRDDLSPGTRNTLGSTMTVFSLDSCADEIKAHSGDATAPNPTPGAPEEVIPYSEEVKSRSEELIADLVSALDAYDFQDLVAGVLEAMGFRTRTSDPGRDHGIDIVATKDPLGFEPPRIKVQVKHRNSKQGGPEIRSFFSTLDPGDFGIFVSTGGFTTDAKTEALRTAGRLSLMDRDDFIELMLENYEKMDPGIRALVPLVKVWLPAKTRSESGDWI
jgi:restriction system protein